jgi:hypothetical protein
MWLCGLCGLCPHRLHHHRRLQVVRQYSCSKQRLLLLDDNAIKFQCQFI